MASLKFLYGIGKSSQIAQKVHSYTCDNDFDVIVIDAKGSDFITSNLMANGKNVMSCEVNLKISTDGYSLYEQIRERINKGNISCVFVDNAEYLTDVQAEDLFYVSKLLDVPVITYGNRVCNDKKKTGVNRLMAMADEIERVGILPVRGASFLQFICGPMNCGKTNELFVSVFAMEEIGMNIKIVKPLLDREKDYILSRNGLSRKADLIVDKDDSIYDMIEQMVSNENVDSLVVDEAQFLTEEQIIELRQAADKFGLSIYCYGLRTDYETNTFPGSKILLQVADEITLRDAICKCGNPACFTARYKDDKIVKAGKGAQVVVDNDYQIKYEPICSECAVRGVLNVGDRKRLLRQRNY